MAEWRPVYCTGCGRNHPGDSATQEMLAGWDEIHGDKAYRRHDEILTLSREVAHRLASQAWDLLNDVRNERIRRGHPNMARGLELAMEAMEKEFLTIKVR